MLYWKNRIVFLKITFSIFVLFVKKWTYSLMFMFSVSLIACGGESTGSSNPIPVGSTINVSYSKGPVDGATAILLDLSGNTLAGPVTTTNGLATFDNVTYSGLVYTQFSGGSYTDEATGQLVTLDTNFIMRSGVAQITGSLGALQLSASPLTEIGFHRSIAENGGSINLNIINSYISEVADEFGLDTINIVEISPSSLQNISGVSAADQYGAVLAAISQQELDAGNLPNSINLASYISLSANTLDQTAFDNAVNNLTTNTESSSFITTSITNIITSNTGVTDSDGDGVSDSIDAFPNDVSETVDTDGDGVGDNSDNCPSTVNANQTDSDTDGIGDACDTTSENLPVWEQSKWGQSIWQ